MHMLQHSLAGPCSSTVHPRIRRMGVRVAFSTSRKARCVESGSCLQLPPGPASRRRPCSWLAIPAIKACRGLPPLGFAPCLTHNQRAPTGWVSACGRSSFVVRRVCQERRRFTLRPEPEIPALAPGHAVRPGLSPVHLAARIPADSPCAYMGSTDQMAAQVRLTGYVEGYFRNATCPSMYRTLPPPGTWLNVATSVET